MLYLVGLGLGDSELTEKTIEIIRKSEVFAEKYTSIISPERFERISSIIGGKVNLLDRSQLEEKVAMLVEKAKESNVAVLCGGDPLIATTHKIILIEARKHNVPYEVVHGISILSVAIGESGLDFYKFGPICTIADWTSHYKPVSFYETIKFNYENSLHSLMLLDFDSNLQSSIPISRALEIVLNAEDHYKGGIFNEHTKLIALLDLGTQKQEKVYAEIRQLKKEKSSRAAVLALPSKLSDIEKEILIGMKDYI